MTAKGPALGGVPGDGMPPAPALHPAPRWPAVLGATALAVLLVADVPGVFTRGDVLRGCLLPLVAAVVLVTGVFRAGRFARADALAFALLALPWLLLVPAIAAIARPALATPASLARHGGAWLALPALALGLWRLAGGARDLFVWWRWTIVVGAAAAVWVYVQSLAQGQAGAGPFGRPGVAGPLLGALLGPALLLPWTSKPIVRAVVVALLMAGCAFTHSRTGMAAGLLSLLFGVALAGPRVAVGLRRAALGVAALGVVFAALMLTGVLPAPGDGTTLEVRRGVWRGSAALIAEKPGLGHGLGSFRAEILRQRDLDEARLSRGREPFMAHNDALHAAVEGGVLAGLLVAAFYAGALLLAWRAWRRRGSDPLAGAALAALAALVGASVAEQVLPDPAPATLFALALATALARWRPAASAPTEFPSGLRPGGPVARAAGLAVAALLLAVGALAARDVAADLHLRAYRDVLTTVPTPEQATRAAREHLAEGVLRWRPDHPEGLYHLGVHEAKFGRFGAARDLWRRALEVEPGLSEARMDIAESFAAEGRAQDAWETLKEALQFDPTRYELALRRGHLAMGPEPVPGEPPAAFEPLEPMRRYNQAERLAPGRFETEVAEARVARRLGDMDSARESLVRAEALAPFAGELLFELFRVAETLGRADIVQRADLLAGALVTDPALAVALEREIRAWEEEAARREDAAKAAAGPLQPPDFAAADRVYTALTVRYLALVSVGLLDGDALVREARALAEQGRHRAALARYRALLAYLGDAPLEDLPTRIAFYERRGNLLIEAAQSAARFDGALARSYYAEGHLLKGTEFLERGRPEEARRLLEKAVQDAPTDARPAVALARTLARLGLPDEAEQALLEALRRSPRVAGALAAEPDLAGLLGRPAVKAAVEALPPR